MSVDAPAVESGIPTGELPPACARQHPRRQPRRLARPDRAGVIVAFFSYKAENFLSPGNFSNIITQMAGTTLLAYGVVFVLLIGEIDLSISYISGIAGVVVAKLTLPDGSFEMPGLIAILLAVGACV